MSPPEPGPLSLADSRWPSLACSTVMVSFVSLSRRPRSTGQLVRRPEAAAGVPHLVFGEVEALCLGLLGDLGVGVAQPPQLQRLRPEGMVLIEPTRSSLSS